MNKKYKKIIPLLVLINIIMGMLTPILSVSTVSVAAASAENSEDAASGWGDADHSGSVFINVSPRPSLPGISAYVDGTATKNKLLAQDTMQSAEFLTTGIVYGFDSWHWNKKIIDAVGSGSGELPKYVYESSGLTDNMFSGGGEAFRNVAKSRSWMKSGGVSLTSIDQLFSFFKGQSRILTMSVPGWASSNDIWNVSGGSPELLTESRKDENNKYKKINIDSGTPASSVVEKLIGGYNEAIKYFDSYVETAGQGTKPTYDERGILNMALLIANGSMPSPGSKIEYDPATSEFKLKSGSWATVKVVGNPAIRKGVGSELENNQNQGKPASSSDIWASSGDGEVLVYMEVDGKGGDKDVDNTMRFPFVVSKSNTLSPESNTGKADVFALSYLDVLVSMAGSLYVGEGSAANDSSSNTSVVGDQINGFLYDTVTGALGLLGIKSVDNLVFNQEGNLFKNNAYYVYLAIVAPFIVIAVMILFTSIAEVFRKSQLQYINTQQAGEVQNSIGNIANSLLQIALLPTVIRLFVYFDQQLVGLAISLHKTLNALIGYRSAGSTGPIESIGAFLGGGIMNIAVIIAIAALNIKFTWRYIARAISFAIYFCLAPINFALDSMSGNGQLLQIGRRSSESWKNLAGTTLMRGFDAIGVVFSTTIGRLLFGNGILVSILGYLTVESITDAIRSSMGIANANIRGISEAGQDLHKKARSIGFTTAGLLGGAALSGMSTAVSSERNKMDAQQAAKMHQDANLKGNTINKNNQQFKNSTSDTQPSDSTTSSESNASNPTTNKGSVSESRGASSEPQTFSEEGNYQQISRQQLVNNRGSDSNGVNYNNQGYRDSNNEGSYPVESNGYATNNQSYDNGPSTQVDSNTETTENNNHAANFAGFNDDFGHEDNDIQNDRNRKNSPDHPDWSIDYADTDDIRGKMDKDKYSYVDDANAGINQGLSRGYAERSKLNWFKMKEKQNLNDEFGMSINKNRNYEKSRFGALRSIADVFAQGATSGAGAGIAYDKDTQLTRSGVGHHVKMKYSGENHYKEDKYGRPVAVSFGAKTERFSRMASAGVGGAVGGLLNPKNALKNTVAIGAMALSKMTDGKLDDGVVASLYAKDLEGRRTGHSLGVGEMISGSIVGRMAGLNKNNVSASRITTLSGTRRKNNANPGMLSNPARYDSKENPNTNVESKTQIANNGNSAYVASDFTDSQKGQDHLKNIKTIKESMPNAFSYKDGATDINSESLKDILSKSNDPKVINSAQSMMDFMDSNGNNGIRHFIETDRIATVDEKSISEKYSREQIQNDAGLQSKFDVAKNSNGYTTMDGGSIYKSDSETGSMTRFSDSEEKGAQKILAQQRLGLKNDLLNQDPNGPGTQALINDMYTKNPQTAIARAQDAVNQYRDNQSGSQNVEDPYKPRIQGGSSGNTLSDDMGMDVPPSMEEMMANPPSTQEIESSSTNVDSGSNSAISKTNEAIEQYRDGDTNTTDNTDQFIKKPNQDSQSGSQKFSGNYEKEVETKESVNNQKKEDLETKLGTNHSEQLGNNKNEKSMVNSSEDKPKNTPNGSVNSVPSETNPNTNKGPSVNTSSKINNANTEQANKVSGNRAEASTKPTTTDSSQKQNTNEQINTTKSNQQTSNRSNQKTVNTNEQINTTKSNQQTSNRSNQKTLNTNEQINTTKSNQQTSNRSNQKTVNTKKSSINKPKADDFIKQQSDAINSNTGSKNDLDIRANTAKNAETRRNNRK